MCPFFPASPTSSPHIYTLSLHDALPISVALLAALPVLSRLFEAALVSLFVDFGAAVFVTAAHDKDIGLFAAHQTVEHFVQDRKSTRLNSSHVAISYAVFCLIKKKQSLQT